MFFWQREKQVRQIIDDYLQETERCLASFQEAFETYLNEGINERFEQLLDKVHHYEGAADDKRREIEATLYGKALIPESRGDVLGMLEALDLVPNQCESVLYQIWTENTYIPDQFKDQFARLVGPNAESYGLICQAMRDLFDNVKEIRRLAAEVTHKESESDEMERHLIREIFSADIDKADKILLKDIVLRIGAISDRAENAADRLVIVAVKRQS